MISSSRIDSAVSGVRSWCEASEANCRSAASRPAIRSALRASSAATRSISSTPGRLEPRAHLPGAELLGGRREVDERRGEPVGLPDGHRDAGGERDDGGDDDEQR